MDGFVNKEEYEESLKMIDSIDYYVADDFLDYFRGRMYLNLNQLEQASLYFNSFQKNYSYIPNVYDALLECYYKQGELDQIVSLFDVLEEKIELAPQAIHSIIKSNYSDMLSDSLYLQWCDEKSVDLSDSVNESPVSEALTEFQIEINTEYADPEESPLLQEDLDTFTSLDFFTFDEKYVVQTQFVRTEDSEPFEMKTTTSRKPIYLKYGEVHFEIDGHAHQLNVYQSQGLLANEEFKDYLFLPFTDLTNGNESYGGGRFIDLKIPEDNRMEVDFNKAYNPYCAYNHKYSCPIPPSENYLDVEINAGVKTPH